MWTPRRLLLVIAGLVLFTGGFTLYASLFGWIDGLPPLPEAYTHEQIDGKPIPEVPGGVTPLLARLRLAFGPDCIEQSYKLKFESREKGLVFAAAEAEILPDGRVRLEQVSVGIFGKSNHDLTTVHSDRAFLTFDQPVRKIDDMGSRKVTAAELHGDPEALTSDPRKGKVIIINNRKTADPEDDLILRTPGPLYYVDEPKPTQPHIWTHQFVELTDRQNRPLPSQPEADLLLPTVTADGMRVFLIAGTTGPTPGKGPRREEHKSISSVNGVDHIELDHHVFMNLWTESKNMIGGDGDKAQPAKPPAAEPVEKVLVTIQTNGPFSYDLPKDLAHFEIPLKVEPGIQEYVKVTRHAKGNLEDTLTSDFLDVQFMRRRGASDGASSAAPAAKAPPPGQAPQPKGPVVAGDDKQAAPEGDLEISTVHAWGKNIALSSDQDSLFAFGYDLFYDARIKQTILKGAPMHAVKSGNLIRAPELLLANLDDPEKQNARARGPGVVGMGDFDPKTQEHSRQAHFQDMLIVTKVLEHGKPLDLITLTGKARFIDTLNEQSLSARVLKLWMLGKETQSDADQPEKKGPPASAVATAGTDSKSKVEGKQPAAAKKNDPALKSKKDEGKQPARKSEPEPKTKDEGKQLPHRLEAVGEVVLTSPDLIIQRSDYLNVWFKDIPPPPKPAGPEMIPIDPTKVDPQMPDAPLAKKEEPEKKDEPEKKGPPMIVRHARRIEAWVNRIEGVNDLDKLHTEGNVVIHQDPKDEDDKGVDIAGHTVDLEHFAEGNYLTVEGNEQNLGEVHLDKIWIIADDIKIDQRDNTANVKGPGSMRMLSKSTLDGTELETPQYVDVIWNDCMELEGPIRSVRYEGSVQAIQGGKKILCEVMQVWLDRPLYLNQATKPKPTTPALKAESKDNVAIRPKQAAPAPKGEPKDNIAANPKTIAPAKKGGPDGKSKPKTQQKEDDDTPKVERVLCDQLPSNGNAGARPKKLLFVSAEDSEKVAGTLVKYQHVLGTQIAMDNVDNKMTAYGPGTVRIFQPGSSDPMADQQAPNPKKAKKDDDGGMTLIWVSFDKRMIAFNNEPKKALFYNNVELVHMPSDRHDVPINISRLPPKALYIKCNEHLEVSTQTRKAVDKDGKEVEIKWQEMKAQGNVHVRNEDFDGWARTVTYSEEKSLLVFTGTASEPAVMHKADGGPGAERRAFRGKRITYNVKTKNFSAEESVGGSN